VVHYFKVVGGGTPAEVQVDPDTGAVDWQNVPASGTYTFALRAVDQQGAFNDQVYVLDIIVDVPNRDPVIYSNPPKRAQLGLAYYYQVKAYDPDFDPLTYAFDTDGNGNPIRPEGMTIDPTTGLVSW